MKLNQRLRARYEYLGQLKGHELSFWDVLEWVVLCMYFGEAHEWMLWVAAVIVAFGGVYLLVR